MIQSSEGRVWHPPHQGEGGGEAGLARRASPCSCHDCFGAHQSWKWGELGSGTASPAMVLFPVCETERAPGQWLWEPTMHSKDVMSAQQALVLHTLITYLFF